MAIIKTNLEAVRYLAAKALYEGDATCKEIIGITTYKRKGVGFENLISSPYYRDGNSPRVLNIVSDAIASKLGDDWYYLVLIDGGLEIILKALKTTVEVEWSYQCETVNEEDVLNFLKQQEVLFVVGNN